MIENVPQLIAIFVGIIFLGFIATLFFERSGVPDVVLLLVVGLAMGFIIPQYFHIERAFLESLAPLAGAIALVIILFEGGLDLNIHQVLHRLSFTLMLTVAAFFVTMFSIAMVIFLIPPHNFMAGLVLGAILGCVSGTVVIPLMSRMPVKTETKTTLSLESALSDVMAVVVVTLLIPVAAIGVISIFAITSAVISTVLVAIVAALVCGILWLELLAFMRNRPFSYLITIGAVFGIFALIEMLGGSGLIGVLVFGIVLSNGREISRYLPIKTSFVLDPQLKWFHSEVSLLVKAFFFIYVGMLFSIRSVPAEFIMIVVDLVLVIYVARYIVVDVLVRYKPEEEEDKSILFGVAPRGLTSAVLAALILTELPDMVIGGHYRLIDVTFMIILITNILLIFTSVKARRRKKRQDELKRKMMQGANK